MFDCNGDSVYNSEIESYSPEYTLHYLGRDSVGQDRYSLVRFGPLAYITCHVDDTVIMRAIHVMIDELNSDNPA